MKLHELLMRHWRVIGLGFSLTFLSSFGQTFFISLSGPDIRAAFGLTHGSFGLIYSVATLASGLLMIWVGSVIDRVNICIGWVLNFVLKSRDGSLRASETKPQALEAGPRWLDLLRDWRFLALVPTMIGYPAIMTAYLFHQRFIAEAKGWPLELLASGITLFALVSVAVTMTAGTLVDRFGAVRLSHVYLLGMILASIALITASGPFTPLLFFALIGLTTGCTNVVIAATLAELYGTRHLGKIRALAGAIMVIASALGPVGAGMLFDIGVGIEAVALGFAAYLVAAAA